MKSKELTNIRGIDVSNWQENIDFATVKSSGISVVYMKASESNFYRDKYLDQNYANAKANGLSVGFYHFFRFDVDAIEQAHFFVNCISGKASDCRLCVDVESTEGRDRDTISAMVVAFLEEIKRLLNQDVIIYTYTSFARSNMNNSLGVYKLWIADYRGEENTPNDNPIWNDYEGYQFCSDGRVPGVNGDCDMDLFTQEIFIGAVPVVFQAPTPSSPVSYGPNPTLIWDNQYNPKIAEFQQIVNAKGYGLVVDGIAGPATYSVARQFTIELHDQGPLTRWVQERLNNLGFDAGYVDGIADQPTMDGIARFQQAHGLGVGYLGGTDWYYLIK